MLSLPNNVRPNILRIIVTKAFKHKFTRQGSLHINRWDVEFPSLNSLLVVAFEAPFFEEEIFSALSDADGDKAPIPDEFPFKFFKCF